MVTGFVVNGQEMTADQLNQLLIQWGPLVARPPAAVALEGVVYAATDTREWAQVRNGVWVPFVLVNPNPSVPGLRTLDGATNSGAPGNHTHQIVGDIIEVDTMETEYTGPVTSMTTQLNVPISLTDSLAQLTSVVQAVSAESSVIIVANSCNTYPSNSTNEFQLRRGSTVLATMTRMNTDSDTAVLINVLSHVDVNPGIGAYTYSIWGRRTGSFASFPLSASIVAVEVKIGTP